MFAKGTPEVIVQPLDARDVAAAIAYARDNNLEISVKSGGHSGPGFSTNTRGIEIDLARINEIEATKGRTRVRLGSGAHWGNVAKTLYTYGLALSSGDTVSVGVGGLVTGGGIGWMVRKFGLAIDSLVSAEIVTADGSILQVSESEHPDLFWGIRGGGGNFGIVTHFEFEAHEISDVYGGHIVYERKNIASLLKKWRDTMNHAPAELTSMFLLFPQFGETPPSAMMTFCIATDDKTEADKAIEPFLGISNVINKEYTRKPYYEILEEAHPPQGVRIFAHATFMQDFSDEAVEVTAKEGVEHNLILQIRHIGGKMNEIPADATAFAHRDSHVLLVSPTFVPLGASAEETATALEPWNRVAAHGQGVYANLLTDPDQVREAYPSPVYERLQEVKRTYDPENIFHRNFNISPEN
jgi:FAD/FMN-containing dehydrogenase